jgi:glutamate-ammonia-ligase adenylyltransferase
MLCHEGDTLMSARAAALDRAKSFSPFLREAAQRWPGVADRFVADGPQAAIAEALEAAGEDVAITLRRQRHGLALAVALGDLSGELSLEQVTATLSDFADSAIDQALRAAVAERVGAEPATGLTVLALGKLGSRELNYSSDVDLILLFDPLTMPRRPRATRLLIVPTAQPQMSAASS